MDNQAKILIGLLTTILILSNGAQYILKATGTNAKCTTGWVFQATGVHEGMYSCQTATSLRYEYCARIWDSTTGITKYWCAKATPVFVEPEPISTPVNLDLTPEHNAPQYSCSPAGCVLIR